MALECELKYLEADLIDLADRLRAAGAGTSGRYFEANTVFDRPDRSLKRNGILLRLREKGGRAVLTVKRPPEDPEPSALKVFEEIETGVEDGAAMAEALGALGFAPAFRYEKVREKWRYMDCTICLDRLPFGDFVEIEGDEDRVLACAAELGLNAACTTKATYHGLNIEYRVAKGLEPDENFVFGPAEKAALLDELEKLLTVGPRQPGKRNLYWEPGNTKDWWIRTVMSDPFTGDRFDSELLGRHEVKEPKKYKVLLHNDDYTTMDFVVEILVRVFHRTEAQATAIMLSVHNQGYGVCGVYTAEVAETKVDLVHRLAKSAGFPLKCSMEGE